MAVFKSKKTYIKRYASKNPYGKIKFSSDVSSDFGSGGKKPAASAPSVKQDENIKIIKTPEDYSKEIKFAEPSQRFETKYKFTSVDDDGIYGHGKVISGPGAVKPEPIEKPDLTNVKADAHVRPVLDGEPVGVTAQEIVKAAEIIKEEKAEKAEKVEKVEKTEKTKKTFDVRDAEKAVKTATVEKEAKTSSATAVAEKPVKKSEDINDKEKSKKEIKFTQQVPVASVGSRRRGPSAKAVLVPLMIAVIVGAAGYLGYEGYKKYQTMPKSQTQPVPTQSVQGDASLTTLYAPEDYIYPQVPEDIAAKNQAAREEAYNNAMANAYVPGRAEVPNLFKYDYVKTCYLTFDDGPSPEVTESILDTLKQYNVPATFFVVGKNAVAYPDLIKRMDAEGHAIGNHSYSHNYEYMYSGDPEFDSEMIGCKNAINNILGREYENMLYRFPGGSFEVYKKYYIWNIESEGYEYVDWTALTGDSEIQDPDADYIMNKLKESTNNGTKEDIVVLLHDAGAKQITADTLPQVIEYLKSKNYVFKAVANSNYTAE